MPLGIVSDRVGDRTAVDHPAIGRKAALDGFLSLPFAVGADIYWLRRTDNVWELSSDEESVPPPEAGAIIERAAVQHSRNVQLLRLLETAASRLAGVHPGGTFVLVLWRPRSHPGGGAAPTPAPPVWKSRSAPLVEAPAGVEEPMMAIAQAATLRAAAASGVPFCEVCQRLASE